MNVRLNYLNNKSRKGYYVYIKEDGLPPRYYKYNENYTIDPYIEFYKDRYEKKRILKGTINQYIKAYAKEKDSKISSRLIKQRNKYLKKIKKLPRINEIFKSGISSVKINDVLQTDQKLARNKVKELLRKLVLDENLLDIISSNNNIKKIMKRLEYRYTIIGNEGEDLGQFNHIGKKTVEQTVQEIRKLLKIRQYIEPDSPTVAKVLNERGYEFYPTRREGFINRIECVIIFRKA